MYGEEAGKYIFQMTYGDSVLDTPGTKWIFKPHLVPNGIIDKNINTSYPGFKLHPPSTVIVRIFDVEYYRESDMKRYFKRAIFFVTGERVFNYSQALDVEVLQKPIEQLENYINEGDSIMEKRRSEYEKRQKAQ